MLLAIHVGGEHWLKVSHRLKERLKNSVNPVSVFLQFVGFASVPNARRTGKV